MTTSAKIVLDSISEDGNRLTTMEVTFHRFVLAEFNTHRVFSRNSASSRAIPVEKQLARVVATPALPVEWPCEQPGMQGGSALTGWDLKAAQELWERAELLSTSLISDYLDKVAWQYPDADKDELKSHTLHKSLINRLIEPYMWHTVIVSSTEWENFFGLRCNKLAQPEIRVVAELMQDTYRRSQPTELKAGEWHTPYILPEEYTQLEVPDRCMISAARCARVSLLTHDGKRDYSADLSLYERLTSAEPQHASPLEHVATPRSKHNVCHRWPAMGNFAGWDQLRHWKFE